MNKSLILPIFCIFLLGACKTTKPVVIPIEDMMETEILDTLTIDGNDPQFIEEDDSNRPYQASATRLFDLLHTQLFLSFDFEKQWVLGKANLILVPYFHKQDSLVLDAKGMEVGSILNKKNGASLKFKNNGQQLTVFLSEMYSRKDTLHLSIQYTAKPNEGVEKGSDAIHSDKGLFFINPLAADSLKPVQIWTQGETENNSRWFPTIDKPNERCTGEINITVNSKYVTLSNGRLTKQTQNADGSRTDTWVQDKPHAPYLFMVAVGDYAVVEENWKGVPLQYFVEKSFAPFAKQIFNHTPEMMEYFTNAFDYAYPWSKYSQIITRDYVSGAMENTTASVFGEFVQKTDRELIDNDNDYIVAHELSHQWFGNLVTIESWANLVLNEGFANYAEYLWMEHKYGRTRADEHRNNELSGYLNSTFNGMHPLIHYRYANKEDMFDAHSYNKGGLVLHHLRKYLGDEVFFASLHYYLKQNEFSSVEGDELRLAFEEVSGEDLNWFFDQWFHKKGHPEVSVNYQLSNVDQQLEISVFQEASNVWAFPADVVVYYTDGSSQKQRLMIRNDRENFVLQLNNKAVGAVVFDGESHIPGIIEENKTEEQWFNTFKLSPLFSDKYKACQMMAEDAILRNDLLALALDDSYYFFRDFAINAMMQNMVPAEFVQNIKTKSEKDEHSLVRESAVRALGSTEVADKTSIYKRILTNEKAYNVIGEALSQLFMESPEDALAIGEKLATENTAFLTNKIASLYAGSGDPQFNGWFTSKIEQSNPYQMFELCSYYNLYLLNQKEEVQSQAVGMYKDIAKNTEQNKYKRYIGAASLFSFKNLLIAQQLENGVAHDKIIEDISRAIKSIKASEKDRELIERYSEF